MYNGIFSSQTDLVSRERVTGISTSYLFLFIHDEGVSRCSFSLICNACEEKSDR